MPQEKRLYRSNSNRMIAGVCGGIAAYMNSDPTLIRIIYVLLTLISGLPLIIYLILWLLVPLKA